MINFAYLKKKPNIRIGSFPLNMKIHSHLDHCNLVKAKTDEAKCWSTLAPALVHETRPGYICVIECRHNG